MLKYDTVEVMGYKETLAFYYNLLFIKALRETYIPLAIERGRFAGLG